MIGLSLIVPAGLTGQKNLWAIQSSMFDIRFSTRPEPFDPELMAEGFVAGCGSFLYVGAVFNRVS